MGGGGESQSGRQRLHHTKSSQMASIGTIFTSKKHAKQLNSWPNSSASHMVNYNWLSACPGEMEPFKHHQSTHGYLTSLRNKPQQKQPRQLSTVILPELLVNVYGYCVMMKVCLAVVYMEASFSQIQSQICNWLAYRK